MQASFETLDGLKRRVTVQVPAEQFDTAYDQRLRALTKSAKIDGFRKGKVPLKIIKQRYSASVKQEILAGLIQQSFDQAIRQEKLKPAGTPTIDSQNHEPGRDLEYTAIFEVWPNFELSDLSGIKVTKPAVEISEDNIKDTLEKLRDHQANWQPVNRAAAEGDQVTVDYHVTEPETAFEGSKGKGVTVIIGKSTTGFNFESELKGIKKGETKTVETRISKDFADESLRDKPATFQVRCKQVKEYYRPEVDTAFAQRFGIEDGSLDVLRDNIRSQLERECDTRIRANLNNQVLEQLVARHDVELPQGMVEHQMRQLQYETMKRLRLKESELDRLPLSSFENQARRRVHVGMVVSKYITEKNINIDQNAVEEKIREAVADYEEPEEAFEYFTSNPNIFEYFKFKAVEEKVVDDVISQTDVQEQTMSLDELMALS